MNALVRSELRKIRTTRTPLLLWLALLVATVLVTVANVSLAGTEDNPPLTPGTMHDLLRAPASLVTGALLILGILGMSGEFRHHTIVQTFLTTPRRGRVVASKVMAHALVGAAVAVTVEVIALGLGGVLMSGDGVTPELGWSTAGTFAGVVAATALYAAVGVAVGAIIGNQTAAVTVALMWMLAVEGLLVDVLRTPSLRGWMPGAAVQVLTGSSNPDLLGPVAAAVVLCVYALVLGGAGAVVIGRRDV